MRYLLIGLFLCCGTFLSAQGDEPDPIDDIYKPIFRAYEKKLKKHGYPVGRAGNAAYVPDQFVIQYEGPTGPADFAADLKNLKRTFGAKNVSVVAECACTGPFQYYTVEVKGIGGEEKGKQGKRRVAQAVGQEEVEPNYYLVPELEQLKDNPDFNNLPPNFTVVPSQNPNRPVTIAVLDTGLDPYFQHPQVTNGRAPLYLWENKQPNDKKDPFCFDDDLFGWDFINDDNAPLDDHSHGTHVASRIAYQLQTNAPDVNYRFMALKMLDHDGVGTTFHAACAVLYAAYHKVDVINASWGFYGERDKILRKAFKHAQNRGVATMTSAGNFRQNLSQVQHYPSGYSLEANPLQSIFFASATRTGTLLWPLTNFRVNPSAPGSDFMAAPGANLLGFIPHHFGAANNTGRKSGTSISTPFASALAADYVHKHPAHGPIVLRNALLTAIEAQGTGSTITHNGQVAPYKVFNWVILP